MRAAVLNEVGKPLVIDDLTIAEPGTGEALVRVVAAGVCHSDLHFIEGTYKRELPLVLGHEVAGIVEAVGPGVTNVVAGDRVIVGFVQPCGYCDRCQSGRPNLCETQTTLRGPDEPTLRRGDTPVGVLAQIGGFADYSLTPASGLVKVPPDVGLDIAALVGCSVTTGYGAVANTAAVEPGSTVAVIGAGGVGLNIIHTARLVGARRIIAVDLVEEKLYDLVVLNAGTLPMDELYFALKPLSRNLGEVDYGALINGRAQEVERNPEGGFMLYRIGDAVSARNVHAAIYDALRLVKDI